MTHSDSDPFFPDSDSFYVDYGNNPSPRITTAELIKESRHAEIRTDWNLSLEAQALCDIYYLLHWSNSSFTYRIKPHHQFLIRDGVKFKIRWNCSVGVKKQLFQSERIGMSFRRIIGQTDGFVLPKIMHGLRAP